MKTFFQLLNHPDISFSPISDGLKVSNPVTGKTLAFVHTTHSDDLKLLIQKVEAVRKLWAAKTALERVDVLWRWHFLIKENKEELARIMTMGQGKSLNEALGEIDYTASFMRWFAEETRRIDGDVLTSMKALQELVVLKQPVGVTAAIIPWNFPSAMIARKVAPTLAVGCVTIVKSVSLTSLSACTLALLAYEAGVPYDLLPVVSGHASEISHEFATSPTVRKISLTGSTEVGTKIFADSATDIKEFSLELGGNAPFIVFGDTDLDKAIEGAIISKFRNSGQTCVCTSRVYAQPDIYNEFYRKLSEKVAALKLGNGLDEGVNQRPLIEKKAVEKVEQHITDALSKGAVCLTGGKRSALGGTFFEPTVLSGVTAQIAVACEETFGPLYPVFCFETEAEVISATNDTEYGLVAYLFTSDTARQRRVGGALEYGVVGINIGLISNEAAPFGGVKRSGLGCEGSKYGTDEYLELKYLCTNVAG